MADPITKLRKLADRGDKEAIEALIAIAMENGWKSMEENWRKRLKELGG